MLTVLLIHLKCRVRVRNASIAVHKAWRKLILKTIELTVYFYSTLYFQGTIIKWRFSSCEEYVFIINNIKCIPMLPIIGFSRFHNTFLYCDAVQWLSSSGSKSTAVEFILPQHVHNSAKPQRHHSHNTKIHVLIQEKTMHNNEFANIWFCGMAGGTPKHQTNLWHM